MAANTSDPQGLYHHTTTTTLGEDTQHLVEADKVQVNLFFDGTLNNYFNVTTPNAELRQQHGGEGSSYENALSNVARMWEPMHLDRDGPDIGVYIEGMGTTRDQADSLRGYAFGTGETGMRQRAQQAFGPLKDIVADKRGDNGLPAVLELNLFGFSRGAATARHFASLLRNPQEIAKHFTKRWSGVRVEVNFVGLFDTVSSEGVAYGNDV
ncbi:MAG: phospholipase effector Tle1 domain-containing protein, partial [Burkholderiaceae bacterium]